jgi:8-amino-7-oxononanoate synthase
VIASHIIRAAVDSLERFAREKLAALEAAALRRELVATDRHAASRARRDGRELVSFCCNDYLALSHHPRVVAAAQEALLRYGAGSGASRLVTGNHPLYGELEGRLARWKATERALVFGSGYLANLGIAPAFAGPGDLILADALCHACLFGGARLSGARVAVFRHNDLAHCEALLKELRAAHPRCLLLTDGVFSMDGDRAPVAELQALAEEWDAWLLVDDAHGLGVVEGGRGSCVVAGRKVPVPLQMGTLSKAVGGYGGYLCASEAVVALLVSRARTLVYSTGLPPATVAAACAALDLIASDAELVARPVRRAALFCALSSLPEPASCIVPLVLGDAGSALAASRDLAEQGFLVAPIRPPTVPEGTARLRLTFTAAHGEEEVRRLAEAVRPWRERARA